MRESCVLFSCNEGGKMEAGRAGGISQWVVRNKVEDTNITVKKQAQLASLVYWRAWILYIIIQKYLQILPSSTFLWIALSKIYRPAGFSHDSGCWFICQLCHTCLSHTCGALLTYTRTLFVPFCDCLPPSDLYFSFCCCLVLWGSSLYC